MMEEWKEYSLCSPAKAWLLRLIWQRCLPNTALDTKLVTKMKPQKKCTRLSGAFLPKSVAW